MHLPVSPSPPQLLDELREQAEDLTPEEELNGSKGERGKRSEADERDFRSETVEASLAQQ